jgi:nucleoside-diphosphate kinase
MMERTLVLLKPDAVQRGIMGKVITRFEDAGFKIVGAKMVWVDKERAGKHYFDVEERRGKKVFDLMINFITSGPVLALCLEGVNAIENIRKMVGSTEPKAALPGTIRGDFSHISFSYADNKGIGVKNIIHASGAPEDSKLEIPLWFDDGELHSYKTVHDVHVLE